MRIIIITIIIIIINGKNCLSHISNVLIAFISSFISDYYYYLLTGWDF